MAPPVYRLLFLDSRGNIVREFPPMLLPEAVSRASEHVAKMEAYQTVYRRIRLTGGLYSSSFPSKNEGDAPLVVHIVTATLFYPESSAGATA